MSTKVSKGNIAYEYLHDDVVAAREDLGVYRQNEQNARQNVQDELQEVQNTRQEVQKAFERWQVAKHELQAVYERCNQADGAPTVRSSLDEKIQKTDKSASYGARSSSDRKSVALSQVSGEKRNQMIAFMQARFDSIPLNEPQVTGNDEIYGFQWSEFLNEDQQAAQYIAYLKNHLKEQLDANGLDVVDVSKKHALLNVIDARLPFNLKGGTDVLIMTKFDEYTSHYVEYFTGLRLVIDIKKGFGQGETSKGESQAFAKLVAINILSNRPAVVLLTDLNHVWNFMWLGPENTIARLNFRKPYNAFEFIRQLISKGDIDPDLEIPFASAENQRKTKRIKIDEIILARSGSKISEMLERYESIASVLGPDIEMAREIGHVVSEMPIFRSMYT
ncbi:Crinkler (CRN) family protein [Thraustotheca clavata]|uniref:Crinkler (CRN) family protein n=1 Tax=Thraustotheca clavata TaxID=74557 RepID=A0A1V9ZCY7_9STRA|nr:Crinkler (CRN) family protein [Thraustotheca clavata]